MPRFAKSFSLALLAIILFVSLVLRTGSATGVATLSAAASAAPTGLPAAGWSVEALHHISFDLPRIQLAGFDFDPLNRPALGWREASGNGGVNALRWSRRENNVWVENTMTQPGGGIRAAQADFILRQDGTPFFAYAVRDAFVFGQDWYTAHIVDLGAQPTGHGSSVQPIESGQSCIAAHPKFAMDFAPGATSPSFLVGTHCSFDGWLALNNAAIHGAPAFRTPAGTGGEFHSIDYANGPGGSHHVTYFAERGGPDGWGAYYSNGSPGHEIRLIRPHRNRGAETNVAVGPDGRIHVAIGGAPLCANTFEGGLLYLTSIDGVNWTRTFVDTLSGRAPSMVLDASGNPHIAYWRFNNEVRYASLAGGQWTSSPVYVANVPVGLTSVKLAFDLNDQPGVLFFNPDTNDITIASGAPSNLPPAITNPGAQTSAAGDGAALQIEASDAEGGALSYSACNLPPGLSIDPTTGLVAGTVTPGIPAGNYEVTVTVTDPAGNTGGLGFDWMINENRSPALANPGDQTSAEGDSVLLLLTASDADGDALTFTAAGLPPGLAIDPATGAITGALDYTSDGIYPITVMASDGSLSATVSFNWTVTNVNRTPVADAASATTEEDTPVQIALVASDLDSDALTYTIVLDPAHGTVTLANGVATYTPAPNYHGPDSFTFRANDGTFDSNVGNVSITVSAANDAPAALEDSAATTEDTALTINVLTNDSDVDGDAPALASVAQPAHGVTSINADGMVTYTPAPNFFGADGFTYTINDGHGGTATATVSVTVSPVNDAPEACDSAAVLDEDTQVEITLGGVDIDSDALGFAVVGDPANGTLSALAGDKVIYTPNSNFNGSDSFTFIANDSATDSDAATVIITVRPVSDSPVLATVGNRFITEGTLLSFTLSASDPDGGQLSFGANELPEGAALDPTTGAFAWTPTYVQAGLYTVTLTVKDAAGLSASETITITVSDIVQNLGPICSAAYPSVSEIWPPNHHQTQLISIFGVTDPDNDPLAITVRQILQDEPTDTLGDGTTWIDGGGLGTSQAWLRAERSGTKTVPGNGRVYEIFFEASDGRGSKCTGSVKVGVPHNQGKGPAVDDGKRYDSTVARGPCLNCNE